MKKRLAKIFFVISGMTVILFLAGEIYLRKEWGFCDSVLMQSDPDFEYIAQPDQKRYRFKNHIIYNEYSQRNDPVDSTAFIILGLGDSVINGGVLTDQDSLATTLLSRDLMINGSPIQVLNISAGSWGPDNCIAYLERYGTFGASMAFLVCSSHDAHDIMDFRPTVGVQSFAPSRQYGLAWVELFDRYVCPQVKKNSMNLFPLQKRKVTSEIHKSGKCFNPGFEKLATYFKERQIPFLIYLHVETSEQTKGCYNQEGKDILSFCREYGIPVKSDLGIFTDSDYRDNIHLSEQGQHRLYEEMKMFLLAVCDTVDNK